MREKGNDENQRQSGMDMSLEQTGPAERAADQEIGPVAAGTLVPSQKKRKGHTGKGKSQPLRRHGMQWIRVENRDYPQADGVVGYGQQQQKRDGWMPSAENQAGHQPGQSNIGGGGNAPSPPQRGGADQRVEPQIDEHRAYYSAKGCQQGVNRLAQGMEISARQAALGNFRGGHAEKQHHEQFIGKKMKAERPEPGRLKELVVAFRRQIRPDQGDHHPGKQRDRKFPEQG